MKIDDMILEFNTFCLRMDWKTGMDEIIAGLRSCLSEQYAFLANKEFDALAENYAGEDWHEQFLAIGQELTAHWVYLYAVDEGSDEYCLVLIRSEQAEKFTKLAKTGGYALTQLKQARKKVGLPAARIKLGQRIESSAIFWDESTYISFHDTLGVLHCSHYSDGAYTHETQQWLDFSAWPPLEIDSKMPFSKMAYTPEYGLFAAIFAVDKDNATLKISKTPLDESSWQSIDFPENPDKEALRAANPAHRYYNADGLEKLSRLIWIGADLLITYNVRIEPNTFAESAHVWIVRGAATGNDVCEKLFVGQPHTRRGFDFPGLVKTKDGTIFLRLNGRFYIWKNCGLHDTGLDAEQWAGAECIVTGRRRLAYIALDRLVELDMATGKSRYAELPRMNVQAYLQDLGDGRAAIMRTGVQQRTLDILQLWNVNTGQWLRLPFGALGKYGIREIFILSDKEWLLDSLRALHKTPNLFMHLASSKKYAMAPPVWSEQWADEEELPSLAEQQLAQKIHGQSDGQQDTVGSLEKSLPRPQKNFFAKIIGLFKP